MKKAFIYALTYKERIEVLRKKTYATAERDV